MDRKTIQQLHKLIVEYRSGGNSDPEVLEALPRESWRKFHRADVKILEGGFLVKNSSGQLVWLLLIEWNELHGYYIVLFSEDRATILAEIHKTIDYAGRKHIQWRYGPIKRDGNNAERQEYFAKYFRSLDVKIFLPAKVGDVSDFLNELLSLAENRSKADKIDTENPPEFRDGFEEGKYLERLHKSRERNSKLIREVKREALRRDGKLSCECCGLVFEEIYGDIGKEFIEAHHLKPISTLKPEGEKTKKEDIALVCSNCHEMLHKQRDPWLLKDKLKDLIKT
jgi:hypothetical protein